MKNFSYLIILLSIIICSCFPISGYGQSDDGSTRLSHSDSMAINQYDGQPIKTMSSGFYLIKAKDIKPMLKETKITWLLIFSSQDSGMLNSFTRTISLYDSLRHSMNINFIPVVLNYDIEGMRKFISTSGYNGPVFIVDANVYGREEQKKHQQFVTELFNAGQYQPILPDHFICDNTLKIRYHFNGTGISTQNILSAIKSPAVK